jgi:peptide/nickel transport system permease protein
LPPAAAPVRATPGYWRNVGRRLAHDPVTLAVSLVLLGIVLISIFAPLVSGGHPYAGSILHRLAPIGAPGHWLGTDEAGATCGPGSAMADGYRCLPGLFR